MATYVLFVWGTDEKFEDAELFGFFDSEAEAEEYIEKHFDRDREFKVTQAHSVN